MTTPASGTPRLPFFSLRTVALAAPHEDTTGAVKGAGIALGPRHVFSGFGTERNRRGRRTPKEWRHGAKRDGARRGTEQPSLQNRIG